MVDLWAYSFFGQVLNETLSPIMSFSIPASVMKEEPSSVELPDERATFWHQPDGSVDVHFRGKPDINPVSITLAILLIRFSIWSSYWDARKEEKANLEKEKQKKKELELIAESPEYHECLAEHPEQYDSRLEDVIDDFISWRATRRNRAPAQAMKPKSD